MLGEFDGHRFQPETPKHRLWYGNFYAAQTFTNEPKGRVVQVGWGQGIAFPGMPFNQQMCVPCELTLRETPQGLRMFARPVAELSKLRTNSRSWSDLALKPGETPLGDLKIDLAEIRCEAAIDPSGSLTLSVRGVPIVYDAAMHTLSCGKVSAPLDPIDGLVRIQALVDRGSIEVFGNDGRVAISLGVVPAVDDRSLEIKGIGKTTRVRALLVDELKSAWP
jgi:fructan beta-fructosidase